RASRARRGAARRTATRSLAGGGAASRISTGRLSQRRTRKYNYQSQQRISPHKLSFPFGRRSKPAAKRVSGYRLPAMTENILTRQLFDRYAMSTEVLMSSAPSRVAARWRERFVELSGI